MGSAYCTTVCQFYRNQPLLSTNQHLELSGSESASEVKNAFKSATVDAAETKENEGNIVEQSTQITQTQEEVNECTTVSNEDSTDTIGAKESEMDIVAEEKTMADDTMHDNSSVEKVIEDKKEGPEAKGPEQDEISR